MILPHAILSFNAIDTNIILSFASLLVLIFMSAMVSGSETALFSLTPNDINKIKSRDTKVNKTIIEMLSVPDSVLATILIVNNLVNICIVVLSDNILNNLIDFSQASAFIAFLIKVIIVTFLLLLFGEIIPKIFASYNALRFAQTVAMPLDGLRKVCRPFASLLTRTGNIVNDALAKGQKSNISMDVLSNAIEITENQSIEEKKMLSGIVGIVNTEVKDIMKSRMDVVALDCELSYDKVKQVIIDSGFSRIPVYEQSLDNIKGVLYVKDLLASINEANDFEWQQFLRSPYFIPEHKKINDLLDEFQVNKIHLAIVVDEYGSTVGLVTLEDILEEVVGEISDESDVEQPSSYVKLNGNTYIFEGKTHLSDFEKILDLDEDYFKLERGGAETIAGLMLEIKRDFIVKSDSFTIKKIKLSAEKLDKRRVDKVRVVIL